jgi:hypothetical protein
MRPRRPWIPGRIPGRGERVWVWWSAAGPARPLRPVEATVIDCDGEGLATLDVPEEGRQVTVFHAATPAAARWTWRVDPPTARKRSDRRQREFPFASDPDPTPPRRS